MNMDIRFFNIVHPAAAQMFFIQRKPQRLDQMQPAVRRHAGTDDIPCIAGNFRLI